MALNDQFGVPVTRGTPNVSRGPGQGGSKGIATSSRTAGSLMSVARQIAPGVGDIKAAVKAKEEFDMGQDVADGIEQMRGGGNNRVIQEVIKGKLIEKMYRKYGVNAKKAVDALKNPIEVTNHGKYQKHLNLLNGESTITDLTANIGGPTTEDEVDEDALTQNLPGFAADSPNSAPLFLQAIEKIKAANNFVPRAELIGIPKAMNDLVQTLDDVGRHVKATLLDNDRDVTTEGFKAIANEGQELIFSKIDTLFRRFAGSSAFAQALKDGTIPLHEIMRTARLLVTDVSEQIREQGAFTNLEITDEEFNKHMKGILDLVEKGFTDIRDAKAKNAKRILVAMQDYHNLRLYAAYRQFSPQQISILANLPQIEGFSRLAEAMRISTVPVSQGTATPAFRALHAEMAALLQSEPESRDKLETITSQTYKGGQWNLYVTNADVVLRMLRYNPMMISEVQGAIESLLKSSGPESEIYRDASQENKEKINIANTALKGELKRIITSIGQAILPNNPKASDDEVVREMGKLLKQLAPTFKILKSVEPGKVR